MGDNFAFTSFETFVENFFKAKSETVPLCGLFSGFKIFPKNLTKISTTVLFGIANPKGQVGKIVQGALLVTLALVRIADAEF